MQVAKTAPGAGWRRRRQGAGQEGGLLKVRAEAYERWGREPCALGWGHLPGMQRTGAGPRRGESELRGVRSRGGRRGGRRAQGAGGAGGRAGGG